MYSSLVLLLAMPLLALGSAIPEIIERNSAQCTTAYYYCPVASTVLVCCSATNLNVGDTKGGCSSCMVLAFCVHPDSIRPTR